MKIAVLSSVYGDYDSVRAPVEQTVDADWIMVSGQELDCPKPWRNVIEPRPRVHPRLASRVAKCNPHEYTDADVVIWIDANIEVTSPGFVQWCIDELGDEVIAQAELPRNDIFHEVETAEKLGKWDGDDLKGQADYYVGKGFPADYGIWWGGFIVRSRKCPRFGDQWISEMVRWTCEDQVAESFILWEQGLIPVPLGEPPLFKELLWELRAAPCEDGSTGITLVRRGFKHDYFNLHVHPADV